MSRKPHDFDLWIETTKTIKPLRHRPSRNPSPQVMKSTSETKKPVAVVSQPHIHVPLSFANRPPPQITGLDRRTTQRLTRGQVEIERRLDLHGTGIEVARMRLRQFLQDAQNQGLKTVLVITGKGENPFSRHTLHGADHFHSPERAGRLRRLVPEWLHERDFRNFVSGFQPAHPKHGGGGAYYVKIRRRREGP